GRRPGRGESAGCTLAGPSPPAHGAGWAPGGCPVLAAGQCFPSTRAKGGGPSPCLDREDGLWPRQNRGPPRGRTWHLRLRRVPGPDRFALRRCEGRRVIVRRRSVVRSVGG